jgi:flagellar basal body rod protein FlgC
MSLFDAINAAERGMKVHRTRSEFAAENIANVFTPGYSPRFANLRAGSFSNALRSAQADNGGSGRSGAFDARDGAVRIVGTRTVNTDPDDYRGRALMSITELMESKSALELNVRAASMLKSMALGALEIGRGA